MVKFSAEGTGGMKGDRRGIVAAPPRLKLGGKVRARRRDRGLTLTDLANRTGLSIGFLSQVEATITAPSLSSLALIASALDARMHDFIREPPPTQLHHHDETGSAFAIDEGTLSYERLSGSFPGKQLNAIRMDVPAGYRSEETSHDGEEFVFVLSGAIRYVLADRPVDLAAGTRSTSPPATATASRTRAAAGRLSSPWSPRICSARSGNRLAAPDRANHPSLEA